MDAACRRSIVKQKQEKLTIAITKWLATNCKSIIIVEGVGLRNVLRTATNDGMYEPPSRHTRIHKLYKKESTMKVTVL